MPKKDGGVIDQLKPFKEVAGKPEPRSKRYSSVHHQHKVPALAHDDEELRPVASPSGN